MPTLRLSAKSVAKLTAINQQTEYRDTLQHGLVLRVTPQSRTFSIFYWRHGRKLRYTLGRYPKVSLRLARAAAKNLLGRVQLGEDPHAVRAAERSAKLTVADLVDDCLKDLDIRPATRKEWERLAKVEIRDSKIGSLPATQLPRRVIRAWADKIKRRAGYVANRSWELLRRSYSWGVERDVIPATPFLARESKPATEQPADRVLSASEVGALWRALERMEGQYADATRLLLLTGVRREMAIGARVVELEGLDGIDPRWTIPAERTKSARVHVVPLSPAALAVVKRRLQFSDDYLFPPARPAARRPNAMWWSSRFVASLHELVDEEHGSALPVWTIHDLRRAIATHMTEDLRVDQAVVSLILSHATPGVGGRYQRAERHAERRAALEAWATWIALQAAQGATERPIPGPRQARGRRIKARRRQPAEQPPREETGSSDTAT